MTVSVLQSAQTTDNGVTGLTLAVTLTGVTAGSTIHVFASDGIDSASTISVSDPTNGSYGATFNDVQDPANGRVLQCRKSNVLVTAGALVITATWSATQSFKALWAVEVGSVSVNPLDGSNGQNQQTPTTTANAQTSGFAVNANQPSMILSLGYNLAGGVVAGPSSGTGFSNNGAGWSFSGGPTQATLESKRITSTSKVNATFTAPINGSATTLMAIYNESGAFPASSLMYGAGT